MELHRASGDHARGLALATCTMLLWGMLPHALRSLLATLDAPTLIWFRFSVSALGLGAILAARGSLPPLGRLSRGDWLLLVAATLFLGANYAGYLLGLAWTNAASAQVLIQLAPLLLALGGIVVFRERFNRRQWLGLAVLTVGLGLFFGAQLLALVTETSGYLAGVGMIVFAAITWAIYGLAQKQLLTLLPSQGIMLCIYAGCAVLFATAASPGQLAHLDGAGWGLLAFVSANTLVAYGAFAAALEHWEASRVSAVLSLSPLATLAFAGLGAIVWPALFPPEPLGPASIAGAVLVVAGSMTVSLGAERHAPTAPEAA